MSWQCEGKGQCPGCSDCAGRTDLERGQQRSIDDRDDARRLAKSWSESSALWLGSWERIIGELGELANVVRARPEGSRCSTVEELDALLTMQADDPGSGVHDADATVSPDCIVSPDCGGDS